MQVQDNTTTQTKSPLKYNATILDARHVHSSLLVLRICPDLGIPAYEAGQYVTIGLSSDEARCDGIASSVVDSPQFIRRAYSLSHPLLDHRGELVTSCDHIELYVALVNIADDEPPHLTPRLFSLEPGDRIYVDPKVHGRYTLGSVSNDDRILFAATGTGEAPHNAMIATLLHTAPTTKITAIVSVRNARDLAYLDAHRTLERKYSSYRYRTLITREPWNSDISGCSTSDRMHLQDVLSADDVSEHLGWDLSADKTHVYLCGNPQMIGLPDRGGNYPSTLGTVEVLSKRGFQLDRPRQPGNIHVEKYW